MAGNIKMKKKYCQLTLLLLSCSIFFFFTSKAVWADQLLSVTAVKDDSFYSSWCDQENWTWLCQTQSADTAALKEIDNWLLVVDEGLKGKNEAVYFKFDSFNDQGETISAVFLETAFRNINETIGLANSWLKVDGTWQWINLSLENQLVSYGLPLLPKRINLGEFFPEILDSDQLNNLEIKLSIIPLGGKDNAAWLAIDQMVIKIITAPMSNPTPTALPTTSSILPPLTLTPTLVLTSMPTSTPTLTPIPTPTPPPVIDTDGPIITLDQPTVGEKIYFSDKLHLAGSAEDALSLVKKIILQFSSDQSSWQDIAVLENDNQMEKFLWQYDWFPSEEGEYYLRAKAYDNKDNYTTHYHSGAVFFDETKPTINWQSPQNEETVFGRYHLAAVCEDSLSGLADNFPQYFYRPIKAFDSSWRLIEADDWMTTSLPMEEYRLKAKAGDRAGNEQEKIITVGIGAKIYDIFLADNGFISWRTDRFTWGRLIYDYQSHPQVDSTFPNFGYTWASDKVNNLKTTEHQTKMPILPPGRYFYRILAIGSPVSYSPEYKFDTNDFASLVKKEAIVSSALEKEQILGQMVSEEKPTSKITETENTHEQSLLWSKVAVFLILAGLASGGIIYLTRSKN